jgi:hypothetical protein
MKSCITFIYSETAVCCAVSMSNISFQLFFFLINRLLLHHTGRDNRNEPTHFRAVTDSINYLIDVCTSAAPGQKECDNAIRKIQSMRPLLENPTEPHSDSTYFECLDTVMEKSKSLGESMSVSFALFILLLTAYMADSMKTCIRNIYTILG